MMSKDVRVILLEDHPGLGHTGDIINVSEGYARNSLFPAGQAALADDQAVSSAQKQQASQTKKNQQQLEELQAMAEKLEGSQLELPVRVNEEGVLYGSIKAPDIAKQLQSQINLKVRPADITMPQSITVCGNYPILVSLKDQVETTIYLNVIPKQEDSLNK